MAKCQKLKFLDYIPWLYPMKTKYCIPQQNQILITEVLVLWFMMLCLLRPTNLIHIGGSLNFALNHRILQENIRSPAYHLKLLLSIQQIFCSPLCQPAIQKLKQICRSRRHGWRDINSMFWNPQANIQILSPW